MVTLEAVAEFYLIILMCFIFCPQYLYIYIITFMIIASLFQGYSMRLHYFYLVVTY